MADELGGGCGRRSRTGRGFFVFSRSRQGPLFQQRARPRLPRIRRPIFGHDLTQSAFGDRLGDIRDISDILVDRNRRRGYQSGRLPDPRTPIRAGRSAIVAHAQPEDGDVGRRKA